jgi:hypothetical protein
MQSSIHPPEWYLLTLDKELINQGEKRGGHYLFDWLREKDKQSAESG